MSLFRKDVLFKIPWRPLIVLGLKWYESSIIFNALHAHWSTLYLDRDGMKLGKKWCIFVQIGITEDQNIRFFPIWKMLLCSISLFERYFLWYLFYFRIFYMHGMYYESEFFSNVMLQWWMEQLSKQYKNENFTLCIQIFLWKQIM